MKLLLCTDCGDIFNLKATLKTCSCGKTKGKYTDYQYAVVNGNGVSMAIGNGSLRDAYVNLRTNKEHIDWRRTETPFTDVNTKLIAWLRTHNGDDNPHTIVDPSL